MSGPVTETSGLIIALEYTHSLCLLQGQRINTIVCCPIQESGSAVEECSQWSKGQEIKQVCVVSIYIHCHAGYYTSEFCV